VKAQRLTREFASRDVGAGRGRLQLEARDALALVSRAAEEGVPILSVHSVGLDADRIDLSKRVAEGHGCWEQAEAWIRARADSRRIFEIALGDDPIEVV
jgi:hypothetical protein